MIEPLYVNGHGPLHRVPAAFKLALLVAAGAGLFAVHDARWLGVAAGVSALLVWSTGVGGAALWRQLRGLIWVLAAVGGFAAVFQGWLAAAVVLLRIGALVGLALAVTLSTRSSDLIAVCERALLPLQRIGLVDAGKVALALALALRFVPEIWRHYQEIREAQAARGLARHPLALIVPLIVRTLKRAEQVAQAIDARS
ncbi:energy-coupling factor transporter transmembrane protein EcfT [Bordetella sp. BOR01]|uniref:energy-coupling factor transporter transmembrane component T family protein n=1 Tax=Bordetella sp. BOR01 TaxID=2854779 RepID=UPI001C45EBE3|nr:energy-coupling factor transporter transmembrane protein EcfT [Bordetella sp. BOR01]MBV7481913.1 energy-coupling factor transporter transmembrane protein EcfT [Bordetella sp. BOR01]